ncbi:geranylgeranyl reductase family protein [Halospeciosus flavus]|uniref:Geranylgeranyl reductase family protein n=1 Tax=Halospeciosus flavus TaxID=3032283 RepID=A0ABD5Z6H6_9EURY|nr:geranylgeranyl reductase family protein [Halospeciosus flavus]
MYDFAVVGAGPPGSRFARQAADRHNDVIVFEQGEIGEPLACSGHVSLDIWDYVPADAREDLFQNAIYGARFHAGGPDSKAYPFYKDEPVSNAVDRVQLDKVLAEAAADAGADVRDGHTVTNVVEKPGHVVLTIRGPDGEFDVEARMVAGCDGPRSRVRRALDLPEPDEFLHGVLAFDPEPDGQDFVDVHLTVDDFFAWRIPRGDAGVEYGLAATPDAEGDVAERFDEFVADYGVAENIEHRCSGLIPVGPPDTVTSERGFLIGDAAGQTKPFTGGGILYGMTAADCAAREINPQSPQTLAAYEEAWCEELETEIRLGRHIRKAYALPSPVQHVGLWLTSGKIGVHMDRPTSLFTREGLTNLVKR